MKMLKSQYSFRSTVDEGTTTNGHSLSDILKLLSSTNLTKQQYLSSLNEFSRLCRSKKREELFREHYNYKHHHQHHHQHQQQQPTTSTTNATKTLQANSSEANNIKGNAINKLTNDNDDNLITLDDVFKCLKTALFHDAAEVRAAALRAIRYLLKDETAVESLLRADLPIYIVRSIDIVLENRTERIQALRLVRKFLSISPHLFPSAFTRSLIAIAQDGQFEHDTLTRACWALLAELSIMNPIASTKETQNCAFNAIMDAALTGNQPHGMCESLISTILYMLNWPRYRRLIHGDLDLQIFVAPFTDSHYTAPVAKDQKQRINQATKFDVDPYDQRENKFTAAKITLISILRSWQGLIYLCEPQSSECNLVSNSCLKSLINMLYLPYNDVRRRLIDLIFELLYLPLPDSLTDFETGLKFLEKHQLSMDSWKIHDAFVVDEAKAILHPLRSRPRMNLVNDYLALLLLALFHCNVVDALSEVIITPSNQDNSIRATILLYQLLTLSYQYLPTDSFSQYLTLSTLISHATSKVDDSRDLANAALINLGRVHPLKKSSNYTSTRSSIFLNQILEFCSPNLSASYGGPISTCRNTASSCGMSTTSTISSISTVISNSMTNNSSSSSTSTLVNATKNRSRSPSISSRSASILSRSSSVSAATSHLMTLFSFPSTTKSSLKIITEQDWPSWDWEHINFLLKRPSDSMKKLSSQHYKAFIKRLVHFFKPSSNQYSLIDINNEHCRQLCETGCNMVDFLIESSEPKATDLLRELLHDISISMHDPDGGGGASNHGANNSCTININNGVLHSNSQAPFANSSTGTNSFATTHSDVNILTSSKLITTMSSTYFLFIGRLSSTLRGYQMLEKSSIMKLINNLTQTSMLAASPAEVYVRLIISCFDYTKEFNGSRQLLEKFLFHHPEESVRIYATNFLRVLLRANVPDFASWAMKLLVRQLDSQLRMVHHAAADVLDEACDLDDNLEGFINLRQVVDSKNEPKNVVDILRSTGHAGYLLLCRYASSPTGLRYLTETPRAHLSCPLDSVLGAQQRKLNAANKDDGDGGHHHKDDNLLDDDDDEAVVVTGDNDSIHRLDGSKLQGNVRRKTLPKTISSSADRFANPLVKVESEFDVELDRWQRVFNYRYVKLVEDVLNNSLTYHQKGDDGKYGRRIDRIDPMAKNSHLPPHLYGQLALHPDGIEIIQTRNLLVPAYEMLKHPPADLNYSEVSVLKFKAALWVVGNVGACESGYQILENSRELIKLINEVAKSAQVLSLRGTAFYVLGLLGSTEEGAEEMKEHGWIVQKSNKIALPLDLGLILSKPQDDLCQSMSDLNYSPNSASLGDQDELDEDQQQQQRQQHELDRRQSQQQCSDYKCDTQQHQAAAMHHKQHGVGSLGRDNNNANDSGIASSNEATTSAATVSAEPAVGSANNPAPTSSPAATTNATTAATTTTTTTTTSSLTSNSHHHHHHHNHHNHHHNFHHHNQNNQHLSMASVHPNLMEKYSSNQLEQIRRDVLKHVTNLSHSIGSRLAENSLLNLKRKFGLVFQYDLALYSEVCNQLAKYNFRLHARRFLQELFLDIT